MSIPREAFISVLALMACISGCGGSPGAPPPPSGTTINVTFTGAAPVAVAARIGTSEWAMTSVLANQQLSFNIPDGTTHYAIAYVCPDPSDDPHIALDNEYVFEATISDATTYTLPCIPIAVTLPVATGSVDASAIPNTTSVLLFPDVEPVFAGVYGSTGNFSFPVRPGTYDFAAVALDTAEHVLGVKILRSQTVPGALNGGNPIKFLANDATTMQSISVINDPWGGPPAGGVNAAFTTANGTSFSLIVLPSSASSNLYSVVPSSDVQTGDYYSFEASDTNATTGQAIGTTQTASAGNAVALALPPPMAYSAPVPSTFPTFTIIYSGFSGQAYTASISWNASAIDYITDTVKITITATASFQNGATTLAIPDLTSLSGFFPPAMSGTTVTWSTSLSSGTNSSGSSSWVQTSGTYIEP